MRAYQDMVFSTAARITGQDAPAQDIAQEAFLKAYENFEHLQNSPTAGGWLKTVTTHLSLNYVTRYRKRWRLFSELHTHAQGDESTDLDVPLPDTLLADADEAQRGELVELALMRLPEHQRVPLVLFHFDEMSYDEIATRLGVSLSKIKIDILRGRAALATALTRSGISSLNVEQ